MTYESLRARLVEDGLRPFHAGTLFRMLHGKLVTDLAIAISLPPPLRRWVADMEATALTILPVTAETVSVDGRTRKWLLRLCDGREIETVLMGYTGRWTVCISTQVGCAMGCVFCATGQMGFVRHLLPDEIVAQVHHAARWLANSNGGKVRNVVVMGMGEPLHNYDAVMQALEVLTDVRGLSLSARRVTISTVGIVPGIRLLASQPRRYNLAISLHGSNDAERGALVPVSARWPLAELLQSCREFIALTGIRVFIAWTLISGKNDSADHARRLADLLRGMNVHVNLIPLNPTAGYHGTGVEESDVAMFQRILLEAGLPSTVRQRRGIDVGAGCGQLGSPKIRSTKVV